MEDPKHKKHPASVYQDEEMGYIIDADTHERTLYVDHVGRFLRHDRRTESWQRLIYVPTFSSCTGS